MTSKRLQTLVMGGLLALALAGAADACDLCALYRAKEVKSAPMGINLGVFEQLTHFGTLQFEGDKVDDPAGTSG